MDELRDRSVAWLLVHASHMVADMTIRPVINALVGPYEQNKAAHRACEMNMDAQAFKRLGTGDVGLSDHLPSNLAACCAPVDPNASRFWGDLDAVLSGADPHRLDALPSGNLDTGLTTGAAVEKVYWRMGSAHSR